MGEVILLSRFALTNASFTGIDTALDSVVMNFTVSSHNNTVSSRGNRSGWFVEQTLFSYFQSQFSVSDGSDVEKFFDGNSNRVFC